MIAAVSESADIEEPEAPAPSPRRRTRKPPSAAPSRPAVRSGLLEKLDALAAELELARQDQAREALVRSELTAALGAAMRLRADAEARLRAEAARIYGLAAPERPRRRNRISRRIDRALAWLGAPGHALVVARSGLWLGREGGFRARIAALAAMLRHAARGADPAAQGETLVDQAWYLSAYPDVAASRRSAAVHYLLAGRLEDRRPHPLFDPVFYRRAAGDDLGRTGLSPLEHFVLVGAARGMDPHPLFSLAHYLAQAPDVAARRLNPLDHYLREGAAAGLSPHPLFDPAWYRAQLPGREAGQASLQHYLAGGWRRGLTPHPLFDPLWYVERYPDIAEASLEPLSHFVANGGAEGRSPSVWFDSAHYAAARGEAFPAGANPLLDYLQGGAWTVGEPRAGFPTAAYLAARPQLVEQGITPLEHWARLAQQP